MKNKQPSTPQELANQINELVEQLTSSRGEALENARSLQMAGQALVDREEKRLAQKLGSDHPRVKRLRQSRETLLSSIKSIDVEQQLGKIQPVEVDETEALVEGRIYDEFGMGISGLEVQLVDEKGEMLANEPIATERSGYFAIKLEAGKVKGRQPAQLKVSSSNREEIYRSDLLEINEISRLRLDVKVRRSELLRPKGTTKPGRPSTKSTEPSIQIDPWTVSGSVFDQNEKPIVGVTIQVTSREINLDESLGTAKTDRKGRYQIRMLEDPATKGLKLGIPLTILVVNQEGQQLFVSDEEILFMPGEEFEYDIQVDLSDNKVKQR